MLRKIEVKLASGRIVTIPDEDPENACKRAADLYQEDTVAWRYPQTFVGPVHSSQIIG